MMKKIFPTLLTACFVLGLFVCGEVKAETQAAIQFGYDAIKSPVKREWTETQGDGNRRDCTYFEPQSYIYYGVKEHRDEESDTTSEYPILWRVLDAKKTLDRKNGMFLLSEYILEFPFVYDKDADASWQGSDAQAWCANLAQQGFSAQEKDMMLRASKAGENIEYGAEKTICPTDPLDSESVFFLSLSEVYHYVGSDSGYIGTEIHIAGVDTDGEGWCTRTEWPANQDNPSSIFVVYPHFATDNGSGMDNNAARPATGINPDSILFLSAAEGDASDGLGLAAVGQTDAQAWKMTLLDKARKFSAKKTAFDESVVTVQYSGVNAGTDEYVSAMIRDAKGGVRYYGRIAMADASDGTVEIELPDDLAKDDKLYVFNEQYLGDKLTGYASALVEVPLGTQADEAATEDMPHTGDGSYMALWMMMFLGCIGMLTAMRRAKKCER